MPETFTEEELKYIRVVRKSISDDFKAAADAFHDNPGGANWTKLEELMWAHQCVTQTLADKLCLEAAQKLPIVEWPVKLAAYHKDGEKF